MELYEGISLIAVVMGVSELMKCTGINQKFIPLLNMVTGVIGGVLYLSPHNLKLGILQGVVLGLTAGGFYSGAKNVTEGIKGVE